MSDDLVRRLRAIHKSEIAWEAADRIEQLEAALRCIVEEDVDRGEIDRFREDGTPSKHDQCQHGYRMYETCGNCIADFARAALEGKKDD